MVGSARVCLKHLPKGESKSNGEVERAVQSVHGLAGTLQDFLERQSVITPESRSLLLALWVDHCSNLLSPFHKGEPHDCHTAYIRVKEKPWIFDMPSFDECVDNRKRTRHKLESNCQTLNLLRPKPITVTTKLPAMSTSLRLTLKSLVKRQDAKLAKFTAPDSRCLERDTPRNARNDLEDVMMTDASTATRIRATHVRQTERTIRELGGSGTTNPSSSS